MKPMKMNKIELKFLFAYVNYNAIVLTAVR